jgi:dihydropteroate synthase
MGILNVTPDSFSDGARFHAARGRVDVEAVADAAARMVEEGAAVLDVGGESTRPGAHPVAEHEELGRVIPVLERLAALDVPISIDTRKPAVAAAAVAAGASLINDVCGLREPAMIDVAARSGAAVCIMHMQGEPRGMQHDPTYGDVVADVSAFLADRIAAARTAGIAPERIVVDPGFGFGKTLAHNLALLRRLDEIAALGMPVLVGLSRKRVIGALTGQEVGARLAGSVAAAVLAVAAGARIVRAHDVAATVDALAVTHAVLEEDDDGG